MKIFLMILLAVLIAIVIMVLYIYYWVKSKLGKVMGDYKEITPYFIQLRARIQLRPAPLPKVEDDDFELKEKITEMKKLWSGLALQGVSQLGTFTSDDGDLFVIGQHPDSKIICLVAGKMDAAPYLEFAVVSATNAVKVISGNPDERPLQLPQVSIVPSARPTYDLAATSFASSTPWRSFDVRMSILLIERLHAIRMDNLLAREPTLDDLKAHAAKRGVTAPLSEELQPRIVEMNHSAWLENVRQALLDNARRKLKLELDSWERLENELVVIHQGMNADEVIETMLEHEHVERLGEQLKRQNFSPMQIFDEINRRLEPADQRVLVISLGSPVISKVFARPGVLQSAGVEPQMAGAQ